jgi:hypothetical protein
MHDKKRESANTNLSIRPDGRGDEKSHPFNFGVE